MKNTSKLTLFAAVVLRALLLIMPISALAAEDGQEIGVPQAMEARVKGCFGAFLSPDEDRFYSLRDGLLTQYQIKPFKKISSIAIDREPVKERKYGPNCRVLMTNDKSKLIIVYYNEMFLLDAKTGQALNKFERTELARRIDAAALNDNELVIIETFHRGHESSSFNLTIWNADTLKLKRAIYDLGKNFGFSSDLIIPRMTKVMDRIYLVGGKSVVVLSSKTYAPELSIQSYEQSGYGPKISKNFQKLYVWKISKVTDHLNRRQATFEDAKDVSSVLVFDQETRESKIKNMNNIPQEEYAPWLTHTTQTSRSKGYVMASIGSDQASALLVNLETGNKRFGFRQYESGEAILLGIDEQYFQLTPDARKYLMMKNSAGKIVPINDATFTKYHRAENRP